MWYTNLESDLCSSRWYWVTIDTSKNLQSFALPKELKAISMDVGYGLSGRVSVFRSYLRLLPFSSCVSRNPHPTRISHVAVTISNRYFIWMVMNDGVPPSWKILESLVAAVVVWRRFMGIALGAYTWLDSWCEPLQRNVKSYMSHADVLTAEVK